MSSHEEREGFIRTFLGSFQRLADLHPGARGLEGSCMQARYILENGEVFQGRHKPAEYDWDEMKQCYLNAGMLALDLDRELTYYEGYAVGKAALPIHHAWCVDADGEVVDTTWRADGEDPREWTYLGVGFQAAYLAEVIGEKGTWGILDWRGIYEEETTDA